ncbi:MAG: universal stress protein, partial [Desulfovibrionaceae bacterium]
FSAFRGLTVTLYALLPPAPKDAQAGGDPQSAAKVRRDCALWERLASFDAALDAARGLLVNAGMDPANVLVKREETTHPTDFHLCLEGLVGMYDAVVLGRRGAEGLSRLFEEGTAERLLHSDTMLPCWVCRRFDPGRTGVLLCLDRSPGPNRLADHVAAMLQGDERHHVTLLHVRPRRGGEDDGHVFSQAARLLVDAGIPSERIRTKTLADGSPARAILREAEEGGYAAVAIGRKGEEPRGLRRLFSGSTGRALLRGLDGPALWFGG